MPAITTETITPELIQKALELEFAEEDDDSGATTMREYLYELLSTLWYEEEGFSGKRPFGNSGWQNDVYRELVAAGLIDGKLDDEGYLEDYDRDSADLLVQSVIVAVFAKP